MLQILQMLTYCKYRKCSCPSSTKLPWFHRAVCLVGNRAASVRTSQKFIAGGNGTTAAVYSGKFSCTTGSCANIIATSEGSGSIGVHVIGTTNTSNPLQDIFAGSAFKSNEVDGDGIDRYYTEGDYSLINNGKTDYSYLKLKGNGLMKGGVPIDAKAPFCSQKLVL